MNLGEAFDEIRRHGDIDYFEAITLAKGYIRHAEVRYDRVMVKRDRLGESIAASLYQRRGMDGDDEWKSCLRQGKRQADKDTYISEQVGASKTEYIISQAYSGLAVALAAGANIEYVSPYAPKK